jgi:hypothetical protein
VQVLLLFEVLDQGDFGIDPEAGQPATNLRPLARGMREQREIRMDFDRFVGLAWSGGDCRIAFGRGNTPVNVVFLWPRMGGRFVPFFDP